MVRPRVREPHRDEYAFFRLPPGRFHNGRRRRIIVNNRQVETAVGPRGPVENYSQPNDVR